MYQCTIRNTCRWAFCCLQHYTAVTMENLSNSTRLP
eukprot:UN17118